MPPNDEMQLTKRTGAGRVSKIGCVHLKGASRLIRGVRRTVPSPMVVD